MTNKTGIVLYHGIDNGEELREYGRIAERCGFDSLWVTERYFHEETFSLLGFLAASTQRIELGLGVTHPALLAMSSATLDRISGGRFVLGLGRSEKWLIQGRMGVRYERPLENLETLVNKHGVVVKKFPDEVLNGLGALSGKVIGDLAAADPLSREVLTSTISFRKQSITYAKFSEQAFYNARGLPFKWVEL